MLHCACHGRRSVAAPIMSLVKSLYCTSRLIGSLPGKVTLSSNVLCTATSFNPCVNRNLSNKLAVCCHKREQALLFSVRWARLTDTLCRQCQRQPSQVVHLVTPPEPHDMQYLACRSTSILAIMPRMFVHLTFLMRVCILHTFVTMAGLRCVFELSWTSDHRTS